MNGDQRGGSSYPFEFASTGSWLSDILWHCGLSVATKTGCLAAYDRRGSDHVADALRFPGGPARVGRDEQFGWTSRKSW